MSYGQSYFKKQRFFETTKLVLLQLPPALAGVMGINGIGISQTMAVNFG
jgi:hypothetical protein